MAPKSKAIVKGTHKMSAKEGKAKGKAEGKADGKGKAKAKVRICLAAPAHCCCLCLG